MKLLRPVLAAFLILAFAGQIDPARAADPIRIGVSSGPYTEVLDFAAKLHRQRTGVAVKVIEFSDYTQPNAALAQGDIDINNFQHRPYLDNQIKTRGYDLTAIERSIVVPLGIYTKKIASLAQLADGASVAIPNDPANGARALLLLQQAGLLKVDPAAGIAATPIDIVDNPKKLKIKEIDAAQLPRSLDDVDIAAVTLNYAVGAGLSPKKALFLEGTDTQWGLWFVTQTKRKDDPALRAFIETYRSPEVKAFIEQRFDGAIIPTW